jgi:hypothetical protein
MSFPCTGWIWYDPQQHADGNPASPGNVPLAGVTVQIAGNGFLGQSVTDASGFYNIDTAGMDPTGTLPFTWQAFLSDEYFISGYSGNPYTANIAPGDVRMGDMLLYSKRVASSWLSKVAFIQNKGVRVTFKDHKGLVTVLYPTTNLQDYFDLIAAPSKGRWIHDFYAKVKPYIPWPTSP